MRANGFYIVTLSLENRLTSAVLSDMALVSDVCPFRLPEQAALCCILSNGNVSGISATSAATVIALICIMLPCTIMGLCTKIT